MSKKIVIVPSFASSHFLKCWIPNVIESIDPDIIIINEGLFPNGPENKGHVDSNDFKRKYCVDSHSNAGFDFLESFRIVHEFERKFPKISFKLHTMNYLSIDANECFVAAISYGLKQIVREGDIIFPLEPDAFHLELCAEKINELVSQLKPGEGLQTKWVDFLETQYYTEAINVAQPKWRRFAYCFDNMENYKSAMNGFMSQNYSKLRKVDDFITYHYPWFVFDKWKELRFELIYRSDPQYWKDFENGLKEIREVSSNVLLAKGSVVVRPSRSDEGRFAQFIDIEHPNAIQNHPNFVK